MATESSLWKWLSKARDDFGPLLHIRRIENAISAGDFDVEGHLSGYGAFNIELKVAPRPARESTTLRFGSSVKQNQVEWARDRIEAGGAASFLIQVGAGADRAIYLVHGLYGPVLMQGLTESALKGYAEKCLKPSETIKAAALMIRESFDGS